MLKLLFEQFKVYIIAAIAAALIGFGLWVMHLSSEVKTQAGTIKDQTKIIEAKELSLAIRDAQISENKKQITDSATFFREQEKRNEEDQKFRDCVAAGKCGVQLKQATCPRVQTAEGSVGGGAPEAPRLDEAVQQDILTLRKQIIENQKLFEVKDRDLGVTYE